MRVAFAPEYVLDVPEGHRFPMAKYELVPQQLLYEGTLTQDDFFEPEPASKAIVARVHDASYLSGLDNLTLSRKETIKIGLPFTRELVQREYLIVGGIIEVSLQALTTGFGFTIAGGTHHAFPERGEGFCVFNDVAIAATNLLDRGHAKKILVLDLDVHQGNGTAVCAANNPNIFTFSIHGTQNYPLKKEVSDKDIELPIGVKDLEYLSTLERELKWLGDNVEFDYIFFNSGVDILESDKLGKMAITLQGCKIRDELVFHFAKEKQVPIVTVMGGGYSPDIKTIVEAHCNTYRTAFNILD